jgi:hypothetical protein
VARSRRRPAASMESALCIVRPAEEVPYRGDQTLVELFVFHFICL